MKRAVQQIMSEADENNLDSRNNFMPVHDLENPVNNEDESDKNNESQEKASENLSKVNLQVSQISIANPQINLESDNRQAFEQQLEAHT
ncbi:unnamed protein product [Blepharisma stoltei]|uniref:Uncharacterized protein n=1 Tax=Blepharisma stoltei TaxID=1481888 RepID=A0AAU9JNV5_9CILI|nr:unnamed protein product [Blepharisma stoltei]